MFGPPAAKPLTLNCNVLCAIAVSPKRTAKYINRQLDARQGHFGLISVVIISLHSNQVAHQAGAYPGFRSMKRQRVFLLPPGWDACPSQGYPSIKFAGTHLYTWVERGIVGVKCLAQERNTMSPARARTRTARSGVERTNHEATTPVVIMAACKGHHPADSWICFFTNAFYFDTYR